MSIIMGTRNRLPQHPITAIVQNILLLQIQKQLSKMKVSIIIPIYNVASYIRRCLLSVLNQTYKDLEVIIINDQTRDNSIEIIQETLKECPPAISVYPST